MIRTMLACAAVLAVAGAANAQAAPGAAPPGTTLSAPVNEEAFEARADHFVAQMDQMSLEIEAAVQAGGDQHEAILAAVDEILARYRPEVDGFAEDFDAFLGAQEALAAEDPTARSQLAAARDAAIPVIRAIPDQVREGVAQSLAARNAPADGEAPTRE